MDDTKRRSEGPPTIAERTMSRRSWLEWLGSAGAVSLAVLAARCDTGGSKGSAGGRDLLGDDGRSGEDASGPGPDPGGPGADIGGPGADTGSPGPDNPPTGDGIGFAPTSDADTTLSPWGENTVDPHNAESLIASWRLRVDGMVEQPLELSFADLLALKRQDQVTDFHCVEGWSVYDVPWNGVHMSTLFQQARPLGTATHVTFHCVQAPNGITYDESLPLDICLEPKTLLAYGADDLSLPLRHGFPLRVVIPRLLGYKGAKTVERIELTDHAVDGFWVVRGYPYDAEVPPNRLREGKY